MLDFILWYNDIELKEVERRSGVSYQTLHKLKRGEEGNYTWRTLNTIANSLEITVDEFYDWEHKKHWFYGEK